MKQEQKPFDKLFSCLGWPNFRGSKTSTYEYFIPDSTVKSKFYLRLDVNSGGHKARNFETETRRDFGVAKSRPRQDTRLHISCISVSQGCEVRVEVGISCFWVESEPK